jgi:uncharacterized protein YcaQ
MRTSPSARKSAAPLAIRHLRARALALSLPPPTTLARAVGTLGFVQADTIRFPARAQDLILRHRVADYSVGDLERAFPRLRLEEDFLYAYGFMPRRVARLLHPRHDPESVDGRFVPTGLAAELLAVIRAQGPTHPNALQNRFGRERTVNAWGSLSKTTTRALQRLHHYGYLRVSARQGGIRIYDAAPPHPDALPPPTRARRLVLLVARILSPVSERSLRATLALLARRNPGLGVQASLRELMREGVLESAEVDGETYLWPAALGPLDRPEPADMVRLLSPFDPIVWDRRRFEHLWGWAYRLEAYTPVAKRLRGYYAMPLAWRDRVIGWAHVANVGGALRIEVGFAGQAPREKAFRVAFDAEVSRLRRFLKIPG